MTAIRDTQYIIQGQDSALIYSPMINIYHALPSAIVHQHYKKKVPFVALFCVVRMVCDMLFM